LKFYTRLGRFPRGRGELPDEAVEFVGRQVGVDPAEVGFYEWSGSTIAYHRAQIRAHLGFRECSVVDAEKLTEWLAVNVCEAERARSWCAMSCWCAAGRSGSIRRSPAGSTESCGRRCTRPSRR
jgi:hypothetical protein